MTNDSFWLIATAIVVVAVLGLLALDVAADVADTVFLPVVYSLGGSRECRLVLFEDNSWMSPDYHPSEGWPPVPACRWVFEDGDCGK